MIKKIALENWKTHKNSEFEFGKGTNVLVGPMGAGKSSVMDGISFALFGTFPAANAKRLSLEEAIMSKPAAMEQASVKLDFFYDGNEYTVERTVNRNKTNSAKLYRGGKLIAGPKMTDVTKAVESILEINYDLFSRAVYSEQNQLDFFLRLSPSQRKEKFDDLLDLSRYETVRANAIKVANRIKDISAERKKMLENAEKALAESNIEELAKKVSQKNSLNQEFGKELLALEKAHKKMSVEIELMEKKAREFRELNEKSIKISARVEEMQRHLDNNLKKIGNKTREELKKTAEEFSLKRKDTEKALEKTEKSIENMRNGIAEISENDAVQQSRKKMLEKQILEIKGTGAECPVCKTKLTDEKKHSLVHENKEEINKIEEMVLSILEKRKKLNVSMNAAKSEINSLKELVSVLMVDELKAKELAEFALDIEKNRKEILELKERASELSALIKKIDFNEAELSKKIDSFSELKSNKVSIERQIAGNNEVISELKRSIGIIEKERERISGLRESIKNSEKNAEKLAIFTNALKSVQADLRNMLIENVNIAMADIWQKLYPYGDYTSAKMEIDEGSYELKVLERSGKWIRVEGILSGGERSAAALCIRISFSLVLTQNLGWLILDEPTHNLDSATVREFSLMLREHLPQVVEQVFVITHDKEMENAASSHLYILQRDKNSDGPTNFEYYPQK